MLWMNLDDWAIGYRKYFMIYRVYFAKRKFNMRGGHWTPFILIKLRRR